MALFAKRIDADRLFAVFAAKIGAKSAPALRAVSY
jgi:hypothetical protein